MINLNQEVQRLASTGKVSAKSADMLLFKLCNRIHRHCKILRNYKLVENCGPSVLHCPVQQLAAVPL